MARTPDFDAWLIAWPSGGKVELHDHGHSTGAVSVISGALVEAVPVARRHRPPRPWSATSCTRAPRLGFGAGHVHDVDQRIGRARAQPARVQPGADGHDLLRGGGRPIVVREVAWTDDGSGESEHDLDGRDRRGRERPGGARGEPAVTRTQRRRSPGSGAVAASGGSSPRSSRRCRPTGALVVDIRPAAQRAAEGELGFGLIVERNVLEWRFDLTREPHPARGQRVRPARRRGVLGGLRLQPGGGLAARAGLHRGRRPAPAATRRGAAGGTARPRPPPRTTERSRRGIPRPLTARTSP